MADPKNNSAPYLVLARKYRPLSFADLIGQAPMVQTLTNAFKTGRVHHAFILTGVRGVGKTTTARILARAFNYEDETGRHPTLDLEKEGVHCRAIIEGRHVDVVEMDAASNTSINDIREIIDSVKYGPVSAPYKVYIIDEVHMLSTNAFNGLLKTLEEPPPYVKFIFATTEIRKVPVTILSRCQRFDLRRIAADVMTQYLEQLLEKEKIAAEPEALAMIVRAGEGSARDCLSLTDQAIAHGDGKVSAETVKAMLGLSDRSKLIDLFEKLMAGAIAEALVLSRDLYDSGADPEAILSDLAEICHLVTRQKIVPGTNDAALTPEEKQRGAELASKLGMRVLTRTWQILIKGIEELGRAPDAIEALEMVFVRLAYAADLPSPDELIARISAQPIEAASTPTNSPAGGQRGSSFEGSPRAVARSEVAPSPRPDNQPVADALPQPLTYEELVALAGQKRDLVVKHALETHLRPISFAPGRIDVALTERADPAIIATLVARLKAWTGRTWMVTVSNQPAAGPTLREVRDAQQNEDLSAANEDPLVKAVLETFPGARVVNVRLRGQSGTEPENGGNELPGDEQEED